MTMNNIFQIQADLQENIGHQVTIEQVGSFYYVITPFRFNDGDIFYIVLEQSQSGTWRLTDHGHTIMHLTYSQDYNSIKEGNRDRIIQRVLSQFSIKREHDVFIIPTSEDALANDVINMVQAISRISDVEYLSREVVKSTFFEDFKEFLSETIPPDRIKFDYVEHDYDTQGLYPIDARVNQSETPMYIFAINSDNKAQEATITLYEHEKWGLSFRSTAIFQDQTAIGRTTLARFSNVVGQQFSSLGPNMPRIRQYLVQQLNLHP